MTASYKVPLKFDEARSYECWKNEVNIWTQVTELEKKEHALPVAFGMEGRTKHIAMEISADEDELDIDNGMALIRKVSGVFQEGKDRAYVCTYVKNRQLALMACLDLKFSSMKSILKRIFGGKTPSSF